MATHRLNYQFCARGWSTPFCLQATFGEGKMRNPKTEAPRCILFDAFRDEQCRLRKQCNPQRVCFLSLGLGFCFNMPSICAPAPQASSFAWRAAAGRRRHGCAPAFTTMITSTRKACTSRLPECSRCLPEPPFWDVPVSPSTAINGHNQWHNQ